MIANYPHILSFGWPNRYLEQYMLEYDIFNCLSYYFFDECKPIPRDVGDLKEYKFFITNNVDQAEKELKEIEKKVILDDDNYWSITGKCSVTEQLVSPITTKCDDRYNIPLANPNKSFWDRFNKKLYIKELDPEKIPGALDIMKQLYSKMALRDLIFYSKTYKEKALKYDFLFYDHSLIVINKKVLNILQKPNWEEQFEYFPAIIKCKDGDLINQYYVINILKYIQVVDLDKSQFTNKDKIVNKKILKNEIQKGGLVYGFSPFAIYFKENFPDDFIIAREQVKLYFVLLSPKITEELLDHKIKGVNLIVPNGAWNYAQPEFLI